MEVSNYVMESPFPPPTSSLYTQGLLMGEEEGERGGKEGPILLFDTIIEIPKPTHCSGFCKVQKFSPSIPGATKIGNNNYKYNENWKKKIERSP